MKYLRLLLFPFSLIYALVVMMRNWFYDTGMLESRHFDLPVISVGNLEIGGAGKSPMTEYLVRLLKGQFRLSTLSRGYGRKTKGFLIADAHADAAHIGDEPAQFKHKFPEITVAVCEERVTGIDNLKADHDIIILDDAYQHRAVKPGLSILLFDYNQITHAQFLLPAGNLREPFSGRWRADVIVISKCPADLTLQAQQKITAKVNLLPYQTLFFSTITYLPLQDIAGRQTDALIDADTTVFLLTGIANPIPLVEYVKKITSQVVHHNYPDHHSFSLKNITKLANDFDACAAQKKLLITTEKDAQRLATDELKPLINKLPILVQPIGISFLQDQQMFDQIILNYVREYTPHR